MLVVRSLLLLALPAAISAFAPGAVRLSVSAPRAPAVRLEAPANTESPGADLLAPFSEAEIAEQDAKLTALSEKWQQYEQESAYKATLRSGFGPNPERINGRVAMFFIVVGLITEYYTGQSMPQQVTTMLQTLAIID